MSTMIVISSSPPPMFARDPTPAELSPTRFTRSTQSRELTSSPRRFKCSNIARDSFSPGFSAPRSTLAVKPGAENVLLQTPSKGRFKNVSSALPIRKTPPSAPLNTLPSRKRSTSPEQIRNDQREKCTSEIHTGNDVADHMTPAARDKLVLRRLDWTPVTDDEDHDLDHALPTHGKAGLMSDFGFKSTAVDQAQAQSYGTDCAVAKRTRIDLVQVPGPAPIVIQATRGKRSSKPKPKPAAPKKVKAAPKKAKTITELVTSHHGQGAKTDSPIAEFLFATQAKTRDGVQPSEDDIEVATKVTKRKAGGKMTQPRKRQLLSPASAMKAFDRQETVFGSASQLARDEPRIEVDLSSDPISPLRTQTTSHGSITPQVTRGSSRFVKTRNLWGAADRDEDNALLHVESIDLFDSPLVRNALAGKDALLAPRVLQNSKAPATVRNTVAAVVSHPDAAAPAMLPNSTIVDVDDFSSPALRYRNSPMSLTRSPARHLSTSARQQSTRQADEATTKSLDLPASASAAPAEAIKPKPNYSGMHTGDLQTLVKGYGFKAIKSREKMVDLLDKCWKEKEARRALQQENQQAEASPHGIARHTDLISNVHDISDRPQPKPKKGTKKPRAPSNAKADTENAGRGTKKGKKTSTATAAAEKPKKSRAKKTKTVLSEETILDVDDIDDDFTHLTTLRDEKTGTTQSTGPAMSLEINHESGGMGSAVNSEQHAQMDGDDSELSPAAQGEIGQQIYAAILHQSKRSAEVDGWDHLRSPTWHEKILMYDPIIIEDLARWLNSEGLNGIQEDREVTTVEVRDWCESKGVCCMWKGGWRGQASKGGD